MEAEIAQLVTTGATTVVGLMATEAWTQARSRLAALFGRGRDTEEVSAELEEIRAEVVRADGDAELVGDQAAELRNRLRRLLREDPRAVDRLRAVLEEFAPRAPQPGSVVYRSTNTLSGGSHNTVIQAGFVNGPLPGGPNAPFGHPGP
ncbi:hypothetical protein AB0I39_26510 [Kitasatospora purpeofusca]|uniref:hypothetical protein n=1 Tax=Kitasatospora purpeofusca TaxID=67352 RepID=UPI0033F38B4A